MHRTARQIADARMPTKEYHTYESFTPRERVNPLRLKCRAYKAAFIWIALGAAVTAALRVANTRLFYAPGARRQLRKVREHLIYRVDHFNSRGLS